MALDYRRIWGGFLTRLCLIVFCLGVAVPAWGHKPTDAPHQQYALGSFSLENGKAIENFTLSYVTHGKLNAAKDNAILLLAPFGGNHHHNEFLIGSGKAFDTDKYFIIAADPIGNGLTTSPSTSKTQAGLSFPQFSIADMVQSQYRLVTEKFGITKLVAISGASMGGMQSLQWATLYPEAVGSVIALVPSGRTSPWMATQLELLRQAIILDPAWNKGQYTSPPEQGLRLWAGILFGTALGTPQLLNAELGNDSTKAVPRLQGIQTALWKIMDANDILYQIDACRDFDLGKTKFNGDYAKALAAISAPTLILCGVNDLICPEEPMQQDAAQMQQAKVVMIAEPQQLGHLAGTGSGQQEFKQKIITEFLKTLP